MGHKRQEYTVGWEVVWLSYGSWAGAVLLAHSVADVLGLVPSTTQKTIAVHLKPFQVIQS